MTFAFLAAPGNSNPASGRASLVLDIGRLYMTRRGMTYDLVWSLPCQEIQEGTRLIDQSAGADGDVV